MANLKIDWKIIAESIGILSIVLSLVFVGLQLRQSQVIAKNEIGLQEVASRIEANGQINEHVDVWLRGLATEKLSDEDAVIFENLLINVNDITYFSSNNYYELGELFDARIVIGDFAIFLHQNPGARRVWENRENRLAEARKTVDSAVLADTVSFNFPYVEWVNEALESLDK